MPVPSVVEPDAADRLIDDVATPLVHGLPEGSPVAVVGSAALASRHPAASAHLDSLVDERASGRSCAPLGDAVRDARLVLLALPRSLDELDDTAAVIARHAHPDVVVAAGGRVKHMTLAQNDVLRRRFARLDVTHARQKARVLVARGALPASEPAPRLRHHEDLDLTVAAYGGAFAGATVDGGTRLLLSVVDRVATDARDVIDLACGTGAIATCLARARPAARIVASDASAIAVASARATIEANGLGDRVEVVRDVGLSSRPDASADLIALNPPFHRGAAVDASLASALAADAARVLRDGGELVCVYNSSLRYRPMLESVVGPTRQLARDPRFTVTASVRRPRR